MVACTNAPRLPLPLSPYKTPPPFFGSFGFPNRCSGFPSLPPPLLSTERFYKVRAHLLEKAIQDREGGVADTPITDLEDDPLASSADGGAAAAAPAAKPRRQAAGSVEETLGV